MNKSHIMIIIIALLVIIIGIMGFNMMATSSNHVTIENTTFDIPSGFHEGQMTNLKHVNISNGKESIFIFKCPKNNINQNVKEYGEYKENEGNVVHTTNFTVDKTLVYKSTLDDTMTVHYWFEYDGQVYSIYTWGVKGDIDNIVSNMIKSAKTEKET